MTRPDYAASLALFLLDNTGSIFGTWKGRMAAKQQRALFGQFVGKGWLVINGEDETIKHTVTACFGTDFVVTARGTWADACNGLDLRNVYIKDGVRCSG